VTLPESPAVALPLALVDAVTWNAGERTLRIEKPLDEEQQTALVASFTDEKTKTIVAEACRRRAGKPGAIPTRPQSPSQRGEVFEVPVLAVKQGEFFRAFEADDIDDRMAWSLSEADAELTSFLVPTERRGIKIDISDTEKLQQDFIPLHDAQQYLLQTSAAWPVGQLVHWLDRSFVHPDLTEAETGIYLTRGVGKLIDEKKFSAEALTAHRHRLAKAVAEKIRTLRKDARRKVMEEFLFKDASAAVFVTAAATHRFDPAKYPYTFRYDGLALLKHYYEVIGDLKNDGEEYDCARLIAHLDGVEFWVRNLESEPESSFWIQTSTDKFYPDFVCKLKNQKYLVVEYKGMHLAENADTREKERLGELWEARSNGQCLFRMIKSPTELSKISDAVAKATERC
jgi:type III restriction enzyme